MKSRIHRFAGMFLSLFLIAGIFAGGFDSLFARSVSAAEVLPAPSEAAVMALDDSAGVYIFCGGNADGIRFYLYDSADEQYHIYKNVRRSDTYSVGDKIFVYAIDGLSPNTAYKFKAAGYKENNGKVTLGKKGKAFKIKTLPLYLPDPAKYGVSDEDVSADIKVKPGFNLIYIDDEDSEYYGGMARGALTGFPFEGKNSLSRCNKYISALKTAGYSVPLRKKQDISTDGIYAVIEDRNIRYKGKKVGSLKKITVKIDGMTQCLLLFNNGKDAVLDSEAYKENAADSTRTANAKLMYCNAATFATKMEVNGTPVPDGAYFIAFDKVPDECPADPKDVEGGIQYLTGDTAPGSYCVAVFKDGIVKMTVFGSDKAVLEEIASLKEITAETVKSYTEKYPVASYP